MKRPWSLSFDGHLPARRWCFLAALLCLGASVAAGPLVVRGSDGIRWRINDDDEPVHVERSLPNGALDTTFGRSGRQALDFGGRDVDITALRVDTAGGIWLAGTTTGSGLSGSIVQRLQPNGTLDTAWAVGGRSTAAPAGQRLTVEDMLPMPDGSVWVAGNLIGSQGENDAGLWRLTPDGGLDYSFGVGGVWRRTGPERSRARSLAAGPNGSIAIGVELLNARASLLEIHEWMASSKQLHLAPGTPIQDDDDEAFVLWTGRGWGWRPGPQVAGLTGLPLQTAAGPAAAAAPATASDAGHIALNPFAEAGTPASAPSVDETPVDDLPWGWLVAGLLGAGALLFFWRRGNSPSS
jgi:uncharacterized delta-60 repeat protein